MQDTIMHKGKHFVNTHLHALQKKWFFFFLRLQHIGHYYYFEALHGFSGSNLSKQRYFFTETRQASSGRAGGRVPGGARAGAAPPRAASAPANHAEIKPVERRLREVNSGLSAKVIATGN